MTGRIASRETGWCRNLLAVLAIVLLMASGALAESISVSAAVSMKESLTDIAKAYEAQTHDEVLLTFGSSGQLAAQIRNGAPVDLFISAANKEVDDLNKAGLVDMASRRIVASNEMVLIVPADSTAGLTGFEQLKDAKVKRLAIGEPKTVPAGQYAMQVLTGLKLADELGPKMIYGSSVRQVLDYVERGEVSAGVVYATDAKQAGAKVKIVAVAKAEMHEPIVYPAVIIKAGGKKQVASKFIEFIASDKGQAVLQAHGFVHPPEATPATQPSK